MWGQFGLLSGGEEEGDQKREHIQKVFGQLMPKATVPSGRSSHPSEKDRDLRFSFRLTPWRQTDLQLQWCQISATASGRSVHSPGFRPTLNRWYAAWLSSLGVCIALRDKGVQMPLLVLVYQSAKSREFKTSLSVDVRCCNYAVCPQQHMATCRCHRYFCRASWAALSSSLLKCRDVCAKCQSVTLVCYPNSFALVHCA